jgi:hypothetical protein
MPRGRRARLEAQCVSTVREVFAASEELIWPEKIVCGHADEPQTIT